LAYFFCTSYQALKEFKGETEAEPNGLFNKALKKPEYIARRIEPLGHIVLTRSLMMSFWLKWPPISLSAQSLIRAANQYTSILGPLI